MRFDEVLVDPRTLLLIPFRLPETLFRKVESMDHGLSYAANCSLLFAELPYWSAQPLRARLDLRRWSSGGLGRISPYQPTKMSTGSWRLCRTRAYPSLV